MQRLLTADGADGDVAGSADSIFAIFGFRPTRDLAIGAIAAAPMSYRVIAKVRHRKLSAIGNSTPCSLSDISGWRDGVLYPFARGRRRLGRGDLDRQTDPHPPPGRCSGC